MGTYRILDLAPRGRDEDGLAAQEVVDVDGSAAALRRLERCFRPPEPADLPS